MWGDETLDITKIDITKFRDVPRKPNRLNTVSIKVNSKGSVCLSSRFRALFNWTKIMFQVSDDPRDKASTILIRRCGDDDPAAYNVPRKSAITAREFANELKAMHVMLPVTYNMEYMKEIEMWVGEKDQTKIPNSSKPSKKKSKG